MKARLFKELRLLGARYLIAGALAFLLAAGFWGEESFQWKAVALLVLSSALASSAGFGAEFAEGTFFWLLAQPASRRAIWFEKMKFLALALLPISGILLFLDTRVDHVPFDGLLWALPVLTFCCAPALTLLTRSAIAGAVFTLVIPFVIELAEEILAPRFREITPEGASFLCYAGGLGIFCAVFYAIGYWYFLHLEWREPRVGDAKKFILGGQPEVKPGGSAFLVIKKEIFLQRFPIMLAIVLCVLSGLMLKFGALVWEINTQILFLLATGACLGFIPILMGALSIAEERSLGVHGWQLTLPQPVLRQWILKAATTLFLALCFGHLLPRELLSLGAAQWPDLPTFDEMNLEWFLLGMVQFTVLGLAMYISSICRTALSAALWANALCAWSWLAPVVTIEGSIRLENIELNGKLFLLVAATVPLAALAAKFLKHSYRNYLSALVPARD